MRLLKRIARPSMWLFVTIALLGATPLHAQSSLLGRHTANLRLKPMPAADVLKFLSGRSKAVDRVTSRYADEGRPWEVDGAEQLNGIVIAVHFVETPVEEQVAVILGCLGFDFKESGDRIQIVKAEHVLGADQCESVKLASLHDNVDDLFGTSDRAISWQFESISALEFIRHFVRKTLFVVKVADRYLAPLADIKLRVNISNMSDRQVLDDFASCIGWTYRITREGFVFTKPEMPAPSTQCRGFMVVK